MAETTQISTSQTTNLVQTKNHNHNLNHQHHHQSNTQTTQTDLDIAGLSDEILVKQKQLEQLQQLKELNQLNQLRQFNQFQQTQVVNNVIKGTVTSALNNAIDSVVNSQFSTSNVKTSKIPLSDNNGNDISSDHHHHNQEQVVTTQTKTTTTTTTTTTSIVLQQNNSKSQPNLTELPSESENLVIPESSIDHQQQQEIGNEKKKSERKYTITREEKNLCMHIMCQQASSFQCHLRLKDEIMSWNKILDDMDIDSDIDIYTRSSCIYQHHHQSPYHMRYEY